MWALLWARIPGWVKVSAAIVLAVAGTYQFGKWTGAENARVAAKMEAIKEASNRISNMENNNADFRSKSPRDRCLVLMRDSGLTAAATNGSGYQLTRFSDPVAARAAAEDPTAGPAIASNNAQCREDAACRK